MRVRLGSIAAALPLCLVLAYPVAAAAAEPSLKAEIDGLTSRLEQTTDGFARWDGADHIDIRRQGDTQIADIAGARIAFGHAAKKGAAVRLTLDHIEVRQAPAPDGAVKLDFVLPESATLQSKAGEKVTLALHGATADATVVAQTGRARAVDVGFADARIEDVKSGDWISFGPLSLSWKMIPGSKGGWTAPAAFSLKKVAFFLTEGPVAGAIDRIVYEARSAGPDLAALDRLRDRLDALRRNEDKPPKERLDAVLDTVAELPMLFSLARGKLSLEGVVVRAPTGEPFVSLKRASIGGVLTGLAGDTAALRITLKQDGLAVAPKLLPKDKVPQRVVVDLGLEHVATGPLRTIIEAARKLETATGAADKRQAQQRMMGAAAMLDPVFRIYDLAVELPGAGADATLEATGSPLSPKGYTASADIAVRGFDTLPGLLAKNPFAQYLPLLKEMGKEATAADGTPRVDFHLASAPRKWLTLNGNDITPWFLGGSAVPGELRTLRPAAKPMHGADVEVVQRALAAAGITVPSNGIYDGATAAAVARFQKTHQLNVDGVVDAATRAKLGLNGGAAAAPSGGKGAN